jgi:citrate lyase beta subunit
MGFDGKCAIHPGQVPVINAAFTTPDSVLEHAAATLGAVADAAAQRRGAARLDDFMVDIASERLARVVLDRSARTPQDAAGSSAEPA